MTAEWKAVPVLSGTSGLKDGLRDTVSRLAAGSQGRTEADIQADIRQFLLEAPLELVGDDVVDVALEAQAGGGRRIDIEASWPTACVKVLFESRFFLTFRLDDSMQPVGRETLGGGRPAEARRSGGCGPAAGVA